ncbi:MAG: uncharacterized protein JWR28_1383, partial [Modestobacter sp.]|nr:uncharacterized protein [Modestobacter sp.]
MLTAGAIAALTALLPAASAAPASPPAASPVALPSTPAPAVKAAVPGAPAHRSSGPARTRESTADASTTGLPDPGPPDAGLPDAGLSDAGPSDVSVATGASSPLAASGIPSTALDAYTRAAAGVPGCGIDWSLIAAIGRVESNHGRFAGATLHTDGLSAPPVIGIALTGVGTARILDTDGGRFDRDRVHDRAVGPMQFIPSTWARYAHDGNGDRVADPFNIYDAAAAAAEYLCAAGGDLSTAAGQARAVFAYNHSNAYVASVLTLAATYAGTPPPDIPTPEADPTPTVPPADPAGPPAIAPPVLGAEQPPTVIAAPAPVP